MNNTLHAQKQITIIIPFLNEGEEVKHTIRSIRQTVFVQPNIILINDASNDGYDYERVAIEENCTYINNKERKGVAASRNYGVEMCDTEYFMLLDAHMRFYNKGWDKLIVQLLEKYPEAILCGQTKKLEKDEFGNITAPEHRTCYGAYISMSNDSLFKANWCYEKPNTNLNDDCIEISCLLGAAYAGRKDLWLHIHGLNGLLYYGADEELLSTKIWCIGGKCLLVKDWITGHIYRSNFPYAVPQKELIYNRMFILEIFYPYNIKRTIFLNMKRKYGSAFEDAYNMLRNNYSHIKEEKKYWKQISKQSINDFINRNLTLESNNTL